MAIKSRNGGKNKKIHNAGKMLLSEIIGQCHFITVESQRSVNKAENETHKTVAFSWR